MDESLEATLRQILQQKWSSIEHYDRQDQNLLVSVFALAGAGIALGKLQGIDQQLVMAIYWIATLLMAGAIATVLRSFVEYYRSLGVICRVEQALRVYEVIGERPSFPNEYKLGPLFVGLAGKLLRTWRVFLLIIYTIIGATAFTFTHESGWISSSIVWAIYLLVSYTWLVVLPLIKSSDDEKT